MKTYCFLFTDLKKKCSKIILTNSCLSFHIIYSQISAIQREMDANSSHSKDKKTVFHRTRKRPDVVQSHTPELEKQMATLSSRLHEIDSCITSHHGEAAEDAEQLSSPTTPGGGSDATRLGVDTSETADEKDRDSDKSGGGGGRGSSLKFSVQKLFAHRTFARGNRNWHKKLGGLPEENVSKSSKPAFNHSKSEPPPDVIDMTSSLPISSHHLNDNFISKTSLDTNDIYAPPESFMTDGFDLSTATLPRNRRHKSPKDRIISKLLTSSHSFSHHDKSPSRLKLSASSPSIAKLMSSSTDNVAPPTSGDDRSAGNQMIDSSSSRSSSSSSHQHTRPRSARTPTVPASPRREVNPNALAEIEVTV